MQTLLPTAMIENQFKEWANVWRESKADREANLQRKKEEIILTLRESDFNLEVSTSVGKDPRFLRPRSRIVVKRLGPIPGLKITKQTAPKDLNFNQSLGYVAQKVRDNISLLYRTRGESFT